MPTGQYNRDPTHRIALGLPKLGRKKTFSEEQQKNKRRIWEKNWRLGYRKHNPIKFLLWAAKKRAEDRNLPFNLEEKDIVIPTICPYLGIPLTSTTKRGESRDFVATLDRVDNTKGYTKDNIEVISWKANTMKNNATTEELVAFSKEVLRRAALS